MRGERRVGMGEGRANIIRGAISPPIPPIVARLLYTRLLYIGRS